MAMQAGKLRHRVTLQTVTRAADGGGGWTETWDDTVSLWARVGPLTGQERYQAQQIQSQITTEVEIRYREGVVPQQRFEFGSRHFYVLSVLNPDERRERLVCLCEERNVAEA